GRCRGTRFGPGPTMSLSGPHRANRPPSPRRPRPSAGPSMPRSREDPGRLPRVGRMLVVARRLVGVLVVGPDRDQLVHRVEVIDEQLPVEMIELVLERTSEEP